MCGGLCVCLCACLCMCATLSIWRSEVCVLGSNSGCQARQQEPLPTKPSCTPICQSQCVPSYLSPREESSVDHKTFQKGSVPRACHIGKGSVCATRQKEAFRVSLPARWTKHILTFK